MIVVTGGAGFIGSHVVRSLVADGHEVMVVDGARVAGPGAPLDGTPLAGHQSPAEFRERLPSSSLVGVSAVIHQGATTSTAETDEAHLADNNSAFSSEVLTACRRAGIPLVYASSASVYGNGPFIEHPDVESPLNPYARSKARFDREVWALGPRPDSQVVGLRYFNVYGTDEAHKGVMASQVHQLAQQVAADGRARIFGAGEGAAAGQHRRDFIHVSDVVAVVRWFLDHPDRSGIFNCGTGTARTFGDLASVVCRVLGRGSVEFVPFPEHLVGRYQAFTEADLQRLRGAGCDHDFLSIEDGVERTLGGR